MLRAWPRVGHLRPMLLVLFTGTLVVAAAADIIFVDADRPSNGDGTSWNTAYKFLTNALNAADPNDYVWVAAGTYYPDQSAGDPNGSDSRFASFVVPYNVDIYGGFAGTEDPNTFDPNDRDFETNETILSGEIGGQDPNDNSIHVVYAGSVVTETLDGFTITGGYADHPDDPNDQMGAGVYIDEDASLHVRNCVICGNAALDGGGGHAVYGRGAGLYGRAGAGIWVSNCDFIENTSENIGGGLCARGSTLGVTGCTFEDNAASKGGAIAAHHYEWHSSIPYNAWITHSEFTGNTATINAGAVYCYGSFPDIVACTFTDNTASHNAGALLLDDNYLWDPNRAEPTVFFCDFVENHADGNGGALFHANHPLSMAECQFIRNQAGLEDDAGTYYGGAIYSTNAEPQYPSDYHLFSMTNCTMLGNTVDPNNSSLGGAISLDNISADLTNCLFIGNEAVKAGGLRFCLTKTETDPNIHAKITNCTFVANNATGTGEADAVFDDKVNVTLANSIFWRGSTSSDPLIELWGESDPNCTATISYCDIEGGQSSITAEADWQVTWGSGNLNADPNFVQDPNAGPDADWGTTDDDYGDLRLHAGSPCIDAGNNIAVPTYDALDLDGDGETAERTPLDLARIRRFVNDPNTADTGVPDSPNYPQVVDIGAYEYGLSGDLNGDCDVDADDLATLLGNYGETSGMSYEDGNIHGDADGDVDLEDLAELLLYYGDECE